jgi:hypothetical protein
MGKHDKKKPCFRPDINATGITNQDSDDNDKPIESSSLPPVTSELIDSLGFHDDEVSAKLYKEALRRAPGYPWSPTKEKDTVITTPNLLAPFLSGANAQAVTPEQMVAGICINIPESEMLCARDQIKLIWGQNTFYTAIESKPSPAEPSLAQYINSEQIAHYQNGEVCIRYEVIRSSHVVGISKTLKINLEGNGRPRSGRRRRSVKRRSI